MSNENDTQIIIPLIGRIDSNNASAVEEEIKGKLPKETEGGVTFDAEKLDYISSAGLRVLLRLTKSYKTISVINVSSHVYDIFYTTGFTDIMDVKRSYRTISIEGCEEIGRGANGIIYRIDQDNVVKVYDDTNALDEIKREQENAKIALKNGIPTAISYDVVRVGENYGSVFEMLSPVSFSHIIATEPDKIGWCAEESVKLLKMLHETHVPDGKLPDARDRGRLWIRYAKEVLPDNVSDKISELIENIPYEDRMIHGDYHTKNLMVHDNEVLLIDMETLAVGHPVFDLAAMFDAYIGFSEQDPKEVLMFQGFDHDTAVDFWNRTLREYFGEGNEELIADAVEKAKVLGYVRMLMHNVSHNLHETENGKQQVEIWREHLLEIIDRIDTLVFPV